MTEPLSVLASIAGLATVAVKLLRMGYDCIDGINGSQTEITQLLSEIAMLHTILTQILEFSNDMQRNLKADSAALKVSLISGNYYKEVMKILDEAKSVITCAFSRSPP